jgi:hypothetical protein
MKRTINLLSLAGGTLAILLFILLLWPWSDAAAAPDFPAGQERAVALNLDRDSFDGVPREERLNQARDWLLFTAAFGIGLTSEEISQHLGTFPAVRRGFLEPVSNFEYGEARSCPVGDGRVIALIPAGLSTEARAGMLAGAADEQRSRSGERPESLLVFEYRINLEEDSGTLKLAETVDGSTLYTEQAGYFEADIGGASDLQDFLSRVDCLTYAKKSDGWLWDSFSLGGRKVKGREHRGVRLEDVVALWNLEADSKRSLVEGKDTLFSLNPKGHLLEATYEPSLKGTSVGMTLFYTDLLAKLLAVDYLKGGSTAFVEGLGVEASLPGAAVHLRQFQSAPDVKVWLGPRSRYFRILNGGEELAFAGNVTELQASSHDSAESAKPPSPHAQAFVEWWRGRREKIAAFEPEYSRLEEIMKWGLLVAWEGDSEYGSQHLRFLSDVQIDRSHTLTNWVKRQAGLKFKDIDKLGFVTQLGSASGEWLTRPFFILPGTKDAKGKVSGAILRGKGGRGGGGGRGKGTSSGGKHGKGVSPGGGEGTHTSGADVPTYKRIFEGGAGADPSKPFAHEGVKVETAGNRVVSSVAHDHRAGTRLVGTHGIVANHLEVENVHVNSGREAVIVTKVGGTELGALRVGQSQNGFEVGWQSRDFDAGEAVARRLSATSEPLVNSLFVDPTVETVLSLPGEEAYLVKMVGANRWVKMAEGEMSGNLADGWHEQVTDYAAGQRNIKLRWAEGREVAAQIESLGFLGVPTGEAPGAALIEVTNIPPAAEHTETVVFRSGGDVIEAARDKRTGTIYFDTKKLPPHFRDAPRRLRKLVSQSSFDDQLAIKLRGGDLTGTIKELEADPQRFKALTEGQLRDGLLDTNRLVAAGHYEKAFLQLDSMIEIYGPRPELTLLRGVAQLSRQHPQLADTLVEVSQRRGLREPHAFYDELNERLRARGVVPEGVFLGGGAQPGFHYKVANLAGGETVAPQAVSGAKALVYVQDDPGLNSIDWNVSVSNVMASPVTGRFGRIIRLPQGDVSRFQPTLIYAPDGVTQFKPVGRARTAPRVRVRNLNRCPENAERGKEGCKEAAKEQEEPKEVILVLAAKQ